MATKPKSALAAVITRARERIGITPAELARRSGVDPSTISKLESGKRKDISAPVARALARELGVSLEHLINPIDPPSPSRRNRAA